MNQSNLLLQLNGSTPRSLPVILKIIVILAGLIINSKMFATPRSTKLNIDGLKADLYKKTIESYFQEFNSPSIYNQAKKLLQQSAQNEDLEGQTIALMALFHYSLDKDEIDEAVLSKAKLVPMLSQARELGYSLEYLDALLERGKGNIESAIKILQQSIAHYPQESLEKGVSDQLLLLNSILIEEKKSQNSINYLQRALKISKYNNFHSLYIGSIYLELGVQQAYKSDLASSMESLYSALEFFENTPNYRLIISVYNQIALNKASLGKHDEVIEYYLKAEKLLNYLNRNNDSAAQIYENLADTYNSQNNHKKAEYYILKAIKQNELMGDKTGLLGNRINQAFFSNRAGKPQKSITLLMNIENTPERYWQPITRTWYFWALAEAYYMSKKLRKAASALNEAIRWSDVVQFEDYKKNIYYLGSKIFRDLRDYEKEVTYFKKFVEINDRQKEAKNKALALTKELEFRKRENNTLEKENVLKDQLLAEERIRRWALIIGIIVLSVFFYYSYRQKKIISRQSKIINKINDDLIETHELIETTFKRYIPESIQTVITKDDPLKLFSRKRMAVIFLDLIDFTSLSEKLSTWDITFVLNHYIDVIDRIASQHNAVINKIIGDGMLIYMEKDGEALIDFTIECVREINNSEELFIQKKIPPLRLSAGIHQGECFVGNIGCKKRLDYTLIGDTVNTASRLEKLTREIPGASICCSAIVAKQDSTSRLKFYKNINLKGKDEKIEIYYWQETKNKKNLTKQA